MGSDATFAAPGADAADREQHGRAHGARVDDDPGDRDPLGAGDRHRRTPAVGDQRREAQAEHDGVGPRDLEGTVQVIDTGGEEQVPAIAQRPVDGRRGIARSGDEEPADRDRRAGRRTGCPGRPGRIVLDGGHEDAVPPAGVLVEVGGLARHRARWQGGVGSAAGCLGREAFGRRAHHAREDLVPDAVRPAVEDAVPDQPLLLAAVDDRGAVELRIGDEAAARERRSCAVVHQRGQAVDADPPHRSGLRDRPEFAGMAAEGRVRHVDREVRQRSPEVVEGDAAAARALVVDVDGAVDDDVAG